MNPLAQIPPRHHALPVTFTPPQCPAHPAHPVLAGGATLSPDDAGLACGTQPSPRELAQFEPLRPARLLQWLADKFWGAAVAEDDSIQASAALRGQGLLAPAKAQARAERLLAQGRVIQGILRHYAQARASARLPGDPAWVLQVAQGRSPILLASQDEFGAVALQALGSGAGGPVAPLPDGSMLVNAEAFLQQGSERPSAGALRALQATFIHPRCAQLLRLTARIARFPPQRMDEALDLLVMGPAGADTPRHLKAILDVMLRGDEQGVVRALFHPEVGPVVTLSPLLPAGLVNAPASAGIPSDAALARELEDLAVDALAHTAPHRERTRALLGVLGRRGRATLADAFVRADLAALQRVLTGYAVVVCNDAVRALLQPVAGALDPLRDLGVQVQLHASERALGQLLGETPLPGRLRQADLRVAALTRYDRETRQAGTSAGAYLQMGLAPEPPIAPGRGTQSRAQVVSVTGRPAATIHFAPGDSPLSAFELRMVLPEVIAAHADAFTFGASQGIAQALGLGGTGEGVGFVTEYLCAYVGHRLTGRLLLDHHRAGVTATRRVIDARSRLDGVGFEQAEREVLGVLFGERSFGSAQDFRDLERLSRCLYEQRKLDVVREGRDLASDLAAPGTLINAIGDTVTGGTWVRVVGRTDDAYLVEPVTALPPERLPGTFALGDGTMMVDAQALLSVILPPATR